MLAQRPGIDCASVTGPSALLSRLLAPPDLPDPRERRRAVLVQATAACLAAVAVLMGGVLALASPEPGTRMLLLGCASVVLSACIALARRGATRAATRLLLAGLWGGAGTWLLAWGRGDGAEAGLMFPVLATGILVGSRAALGAAAVSAAAAGAVAWSIARGWLEGSDQPLSSYWAMFAAGYFAVALFTGVTQRAIRASLLAAEASEKRARESEERYRALAEHNRDLVTMLDGSGRIVYASPSYRDVLGYAPESVMGRSPLGDVHPHDAARAAARLAHGLAGNEVPSEVFRLRHADGSWREIEASARPYRAADGERRLVSVLRDVTERSALDRRLRESQKLEAVGRLAGGVAHDFNNLLTAVVGNAELLEGMDLPKEARESVLEILDASERGAALTRQLLTFGRRQRREPRVVDACESVRSLERLLRRLLGEDLEIELALDPRAPRTSIDPGELEQIVLNLALNARDAMPEGGRMSISVRPGSSPDGPEAGPGVMLEVTDSGSGIAAEVRPLVFEPFYSTKPDGTGLGLSTVLGIAKSCGGTVVAEDAPRGGTRVGVFLPAAGEEEVGEEDATAASPEPSAPEGGTETVLLVEDDDAVRQLARTGLAELGYRALVATNGEEALAVAAAHDEPIHLLLSDVVMPGMNGFELARRLRGERSDLRLLFVSGYPERAGASAEVERVPPGAHFLPKPFTARQLGRHVRRALAAPPPEAPPPRTKPQSR